MVVNWNCGGELLIITWDFPTSFETTRAPHITVSWIIHTLLETFKRDLTYPKFNNRHESTAETGTPSANYTNLSMRCLIGGHGHGLNRRRLQLQGRLIGVRHRNKDRKETSPRRRSLILETETFRLYFI